MDICLGGSFWIAAVRARFRVSSFFVVLVPGVLLAEKYEIFALVNDLLRLAVVDVELWSVSSGLRLGVPTY